MCLSNTCKIPTEPTRHTPQTPGSNSCMAQFHDKHMSNSSEYQTIVVGANVGQHELSKCLHNRRVELSLSFFSQRCCGFMFSQKINAISRRVFDVVTHKPTKVQPRQADLEGAAS